MKTSGKKQRKMMEKSKENFDLRLGRSDEEVRKVRRS